MARYLFGGNISDFVFAVKSGSLVSGGSIATITFWTAPTGGTQIADLTDLSSNPITSVSPNSNGYYAQFYGPDTGGAFAANATQMWADAGTGQRVLVTTVDPSYLSGTYVPLSNPTHDVPALGLYFPESQGAVGDGSHDDTAALIAATAKVKALRQAVIGGNVFAPGGTLKLVGTYNLASLAAPIVLSCNVDASEATVIVPASYNQAVFVVGHETSGDVLTSAKIHMPIVTKSGATSLVAGSVGIQIQNLYHSKVFCKRQTYFETGLELTGLGQGTVYNEINPGWTDLCKISHALIPQTGGWVNQNTFVSGGISQSPNTLDGGTVNDVRRAGYRHVKIDGSAGVGTVNGNTWDGTSFEGNLSEFYFDTKASADNVWTGACRFEQGTAATATTLTTDTFNATAHGLVVGDMVVFFANATRPGGMVTGISYYVSVVVDANNFKVSETHAGNTVSFSSNGSGVVYYVPPRIQFDNTGATGSSFGNRIQAGYYAYPGPLDARQIGTTGVQNDIAPFAPRHGDQMVARNRLRNGNFRTNQRGYTSGSFIASGVYGFDGWKSTTNGTTLTFTAAPQGQQVICNSGSIAQVIEQGNMEAGTYTLTWRGTSTGRIYNSGASAPTYASSPITVDIDGTANVIVEFTSGDLGRVQVERGTVSTPFEREPTSVELERCKRYYQRFGSVNEPLGMGIANATTSAFMPIRLPVEMRAVPTATITNPTAFRLNTGGSVVNPTTVSLDAASTTKDIRLDYGTTGSLTAGQALYMDTGATGILELSAEL